MDTTTDLAPPHHDPNVAALMRATQKLARDDGVTPTPIPDVCGMRISHPVAFHRGRNAGMSLAVAVSGQKNVTAENTHLINDARHFMVLHGERSYEANVQASINAPYIALKIQLPPEMVAETLVELAESGFMPDAAHSRPSPAIFCDLLTDKIADPLLRLLQCFVDPADCRMLASSYLREICYRLLRSDAATMLRASVTPEDTKLISAQHFIKSNASRALTVAEIASEMAMSPSHFAHRFRACFGVSPMRYHKQVRLERARQMLLHKSVSVSHTANAIGYASDAHFSRDFKEQFGLPPRKYADQLTAQLKG